MDFLSSDIAVTPLAKVLEVNDGRQCLAVSEPIQISWPSVESTAEQRTEQGTRSSGRFYSSRFFFFHSTEWNTFPCMHVAPSILFCVSTKEQRARRQFLLDNFPFSSCVVVGFVCSRQLRLQSRRFVLSGPAKTRCDYFHTLFLADGGFFVCRNRKKWIQMRKWPGTGP